MGFLGGLGLLGPGKSLPPSVQSSRQGWSQKIRHGLPHLDLQMGPGGPGFQVTMGKMMGTMPVVELVVVDVGCPPPGGVYVYGQGGDVMVRVTTGCETPDFFSGFGSSLIVKGDGRMLGVMRNVEYAPEVVRVSDTV